MVASADLLDRSVAVGTGPVLVRVQICEIVKVHAFNAFMPLIPTFEAERLGALSADPLVTTARTFGLLDYCATVRLRTIDHILVLGHFKFFICFLEFGHHIVCQFQVL